MKVFFDASVLFSAIYSQTGASRWLVYLIKQGRIRGIVTRTIIEELEDNLCQFKDIEAEDIHLFIQENKFIVAEALTSGEIESYSTVVDSDDAHVVAGAIIIGCDYLVTFDKKHLDNPTVKKKVRGVKIISPKELLEILSKY